MYTLCVSVDDSDWLCCNDVIPTTLLLTVPQLTLSPLYLYYHTDVQ